MPIELDNERIDALLNRETSKGVYKQVLTDFVASSSRGIDVTADFPGKKLESAANSLKRIQKANEEFSNVVVIYVSKYGNDAESLSLIKKEA